MADLDTVTARLKRHAITALHPRMAILLRGLRHTAKTYGVVSIDPITRPALSEVLPHGLYYVYGNTGAFSGKGDRDLDVLYQTLAVDEPMHTQRVPGSISEVYRVTKGTYMVYSTGTHRTLSVYFQA